MPKGVILYKTLEELCIAAFNGATFSKEEGVHACQTGLKLVLMMVLIACYAFEYSLFQSIVSDISNHNNIIG